MMRIIRMWLPLAATISLMCGLIYLINQQALRLGANEPQIQLAEDGAAALAAGQPVSGVFPTGKVDIAASLAPYWIVFDASGKPLASNAVLHGAIPPVPVGALDAAKSSGQNRVTLQPEAGVRSAAVIVPVNGGPGGYVLEARSLREVEKRIDLLGLQVLAGWLASLAVALAVVGVVEWLSP